MFFLSTKSTNFFLLALSVALLAASSALEADAVPVGKGIFRAASCGEAQAEFVSAPQLHGINHSRNALEIVNAGSGTAGARINFVYPEGSDFESADAFIDFQVHAKHDAGANENTVLEFCFRGEDRKIHRITRLLSDLRQTGGNSILDWRIRGFNWKQITEFDAKKAKLVSVSFTLASRGNLTLGWNILQLNSLRQISAAELDLTVNSCSILDGCGEVKLRRLEISPLDRRLRRLRRN